MKKTVPYLCSILLTALSGPALADWFLSSQTKTLITQADQGDVQSQFLVGSAYDTGNGAQRSGEKAKKYYRMAADQGFADAQNSLGSALQAEKRYAEALPWYEKASAQSHALATNNLAYLYDLGLGVPQDRRKGFELYSRAANLGWAEAMWNIANMYGAGQLGETDMVTACIWTLRAGRFAKDNEQQLKAYVSRVLPQLKLTLTIDQFDSCKQQAESWSPTLGAAADNSQPATPEGRSTDESTPRP